MGSDKHNIQIEVSTQYIEEQSAPEQSRYVFSYNITIKNMGNIPAQLLTRHWIITDANNKVHEVKGDGVVGEQPHILPGEDFSYTSGTIIETSVGSMAGSYEMIADDNTKFDAEIPAFSLSVPRTLH